MDIAWHVLEIFLLFTVGALLGMVGFVVVVIDKFGSLRSKIEPVVNELRPIDSLFRLGITTISNESQAMWHHCWSLQLYLV
jgi:hypothetical protein